MITQQKKVLIVSEMSKFPQKPRRFRVEEMRNYYANHVGQVLYLGELLEIEQAGVDVKIMVLN